MFAQPNSSHTNYGVKLGLVHTYLRYKADFAANNYFTYSPKEGFHVNFFWRKPIGDKLLTQVELGYLNRIVRDNFLRSSPLTEVGKPLNLHYISIPMLLSMEGPNNIYFGAGGTANVLILGPERSISQHETELAGLFDITKRFGNHWGISIQYQRGFSKLGKDYHIDPITKIDGYIELYSRSFLFTFCYNAF